MRLISLAPVLAGGLILGWAATAQAAPAAPPAAPPAEPIFYCPSPPVHAAVRRAGPRRAGARHHACPSERMAHADHRDHGDHWRGHDGERMMAMRDHDDVSQSQAFIYRYERALHGLDAHAADEAWAHPGGFWPRGPQAMADADGRAWRGYEEHGGGDHMMGPDHQGDRDHMMGPDHHDGADLEDRDGNRHYGYLDERREHGDLMGPPDRRGDAEAALRADDGARAGYRYERRERETSGEWASSGWTAAERASGGEVRDHVWSYRSGDASGWAHHGGRPGDGQWRDGSYGQVVEYAGRDAYGYLVWPGKTPQPRPDADPDPDHDR